MGGHPGEANLRRRGVKVLIHDLAQFAAVDSPGKIDGKTAEIQRFRPPQSHLFIGDEGHHDIAVTMFRRQVFQHRHHHRDRRFVVGAEHTGAIAENNLFVRIGENLRMLGNPQPDLLFTIQAQILAGKTQNLWMNVRGQPDVHGVDVGDKANPRRARDIPSFYRGDGGMVINHDIVQPKAA